MPQAIAADCAPGKQSPSRQTRSSAPIVWPCVITDPWRTWRNCKRAPSTHSTRSAAGPRNCLLCQLNADATGVPLIAGPVEATAIGNAALQAVSLGELGSLHQARDLIRRCAEVTVYEPAPRVQWDEAYARFASLLEANRA